MRRALLSVSDKTGLVEFATGLHDRGFELVSTGGTARALTEAGLPVIPVSQVTGVPEMMDGRVKTLHPRIHGGILARRDTPAHLEDARRNAIGLIDVVAVNLYPFQRAATDPSTPFERLVEEIDIGGPSMVRSAAKNFRDVLIVVSPEDYPYVLEALDAPSGPPLSFRLTLSQRAFAHTAEYDAVISSTLAKYAVAGPGRFARASDLASEEPGHDATASFSMTLTKLQDLRYGENPHQWAALYAGWEEHFEPFSILQGKELSFTNLLDLDAAARIVLEFDEPTAVVIKHTNPCGVATGATAAEAYVRARDADALSAFGGIVGLNRTLDEETARAITSTFIEAVIAPSVDPAAVPALATKGKMRVVTWSPEKLAQKGGSPFEGTELKSILGGVLIQVRDQVLEARHHWPDESLGIRVVTRRQPTDDEWQALRFAWRVCAHVKSNTVIFTGADRTLAMGAGQMSRVDAVRVAVMKAEASGLSLRESVAASDAFFPFRDGLDALADAGATAVVQPGGSVRDAEVIAAADEHGIAMVFTGRRHFRH